MKDQLATPVTLAIRLGIVGIAFLTPLFFLPITSEFYQFNKQILVIIVAAILLILWGIRMGVEGKMRIVRSPLDLPMLAFALAFLLAAIFSVDRYVSLAGFYPRFHGSLVSALAYVSIFFVAVSNLDKQSRVWVVWAFIGSGALLALLGVAHFFGYYIITASYAKVRTWTPIGNSANLSLYLALVLPLALGAAITTKNRTLQTLFIIAAIAMAFPIILFKLVGPMLAATAGLVVGGLFLTRTKMENHQKALIGIFAVVVGSLLLLNLVPELRKIFLEPLRANKQGSFEVTADRTLPLDSAWRISTQAVGQRPFLGVGPGTFAYSFTAFKGPELNSDNYWNLRFDLAGNEYLTLLTSLGVVGIIVFAYLIFSLSKGLLGYTYRSPNIKDNPIAVFLMASLVVFLVGIFFQDTTASIWVFFVLLAALTYSYFKDWGVKGVEEKDVKFVAINSGGVQFADTSERHKDSTLGTVFTIVGVAAFLGALYFGLPAYRAEVSYQKALAASADNKAADTRAHLLAAIGHNENRDTYRRSLVVLDRLLATNLSRAENKTEQDNRNIAGLVNESIQQGLRITGYQGRGLNSFTIDRKAGTSPLNVANWEALSGVLNSLELEGELRARNAADAINVAQQAVALDPRNPILLESLGNILLKNNLVDNAIQAYEQAIRVRPNYASARYNLATALRQKGDNPQRVVLELEAALSLLPENSQDRARIETELTEAKKKRDEATTSANQNN